MNTAQAIGMLFYGMGIGVALAAPVGPINIEIVRRGLLSGSRSGWLVGLGALSADTLFATLIVSGLTSFADRPELRAPLFAAGALMLGYVGTGSLLQAYRGTIALRGEARRGSHSYITGFLMAALNPMGIVYWLSVGSALVAEAVAKVGRIGSPLLVGGVFIGIFCWISFLSALVHFGRRYVNDRAMRWITAAGGGVLIAFAIWFVVQTVRSLDAL